MELTPPSTDKEIGQFEQRKADHIRLALASENEALGGSLFDHIQLIHEALPDINFSDIDLSTSVLGRTVPAPFMVSAMTAGHANAGELNRRLAVACAKQGWWMGVGSQRRQLFDQEAKTEWIDIRKEAEGVCFVGNLGIAQAIESSVDQIEELIDSLGAVAMAVHLNGLQECLQSEGTPNFRGGLEKLSELAEKLSVPLIVKETGCGFSRQSLTKLMGRKLGAVDVSGFGGTHWGRIEGARAAEKDWRREAGSVFSNWGISTVESLIAAAELDTDFEIWASGGIRSGLDAAISLALGAKMVGFAKPALVAALESDIALNEWMKAKEFELKTAMFCTGMARIIDLQKRRVWQWRKI